MSGERRNRDQGDVLGVFDRNGNLVFNVDKVIIRAEDVIIIKDDDHRGSDREDVAGATDRNNRKDYRSF